MTKTTNHRIWTIAKETARLVSEAGFKVTPVDCSINRNGDYSAYFNVVGHFQVRISDHSTNRMYDMPGWYDVNPDSAEKTAAEIIAHLTSAEYIERSEAARKAAAERAAEREAAAAAGKARLDAIKAEQLKNIAAKAEFLKANGLENATKTAQEKAWRAHKKTIREMEA